MAHLSVCNSCRHRSGSVGRWRERTRGRPAANHRQLPLNVTLCLTPRDFARTHVLHLAGPTVCHVITSLWSRDHALTCVLRCLVRQALVVNLSVRLSVRSLWPQRSSFRQPVQRLDVPHSSVHEHSQHRTPVQLPFRQYGSRWRS